MTFQGIKPQALRFFRAPGFHQTKEWFEANREIYETEIKAPLGDFVEDVVARARQGENPDQGRPKIVCVPIHRDVRFSKNKDPYKTNAGVALTRGGSKSDPGVLYFHLSPEECFFAAGFHAPDPHELARLRASAVRAPRHSRHDSEAVPGGTALSDEDTFKRAPRGLEGVEDAEIVAAIRFAPDLLEPVGGDADRRAGARRRLLRLRPRRVAVALMGLGSARRSPLTPGAQGGSGFGQVSALGSVPHGKSHPFDRQDHPRLHRAGSIFSSLPRPRPARG